jgi:hypothetical protein
MRAGVRLALVASLFTASASARAPHIEPQADGWARGGNLAIRGLTVGPIENAYHAEKGYGSPAFAATLAESEAMGARWIALTVFGRVADLAGMGVDPTFETPWLENVTAVERAIDLAHARGLSVMLVPHLWVESGAWRAEIDPKTNEGWARWTQSYTRFVAGWAQVAERKKVELFSAGVELRSWVTTPRAPSFVTVVREIRAIYKGPVTYSANWDDAEHTVILGELDVIGINAFFPLAEHEGAGPEELRAGAQRWRAKMHDLAAAWNKPLLFTEFGYTTRPDPALRPWEWPDAMKDVRVDQYAQSAAYTALLEAMIEEENFAGLFVWRLYADPHDTSQEAEWGFSPRGKWAEIPLRDAFATRWRSDGPIRFMNQRAAKSPGLY